MAQRWQQASLAARIAVGCAALVSVCSGCAIVFALGFAAGANDLRIASSRAPNHADTQAALATATAQAALAAATAQAPKAWVTIQHFIGHDNQQTPSFSAAGTWRIVWTCKTNNPRVGSGAFSVELNRDDGTPVDLVANTSSNGGATYNAHTGDGTFYLKIEALFMDYDVSIQEYR
jgi:hypothetical protein